MMLGTKTIRLAARWAPLAFGFCLIFGLLGPYGLVPVQSPVKTCKAWRSPARGVLAASMHPMPAPLTALPLLHAELPLKMSLPPALQEPISGPELYVGSGELGAGAKRRAFAKRTRPRRPNALERGRIARVRLRAAGKYMSALEYRVGKPLRPETVRLPDRAQLRVMVSANSASIRRLKNFARSKRGFSVKTRALGGSKLALHLSCDARCELGTVQSFAKGWSVQIRHLDKASLSLR